MSFAERRNNLGKCWWLNVFPLVVCSLSSFAQPRYLCEYGAADNLLLSAPAAGGLPGLSPIVHDAPSGKVLRAGDKAFTYDAWGRVKTVSLVSGGGGSGTLTADHDANGNRTRLGSDYLGWNVRGQLASMTSGGQSSTFGYDLYNRHISKSVSGNSPRSYRWSGWRSHGGTGSGVFAKTTGVDNHASLGGNATITDHLGSVVTLLNSSGQVAQSNSFDPFGRTISSTNSNGFGGQPYGASNSSQVLAFSRHLRPRRISVV